MSHADAVLGACAGKTYKVLRADLGSKDGCADDIPGFALAEEVVLRVGTLHFLFVFLDGAVDRPYDGQHTDGKYRPVKP